MKQKGSKIQRKCTKLRWWAFGVWYAQNIESFPFSLTIPLLRDKIDKQNGQFCTRSWLTVPSFYQCRPYQRVCNRVFRRAPSCPCPWWPFAGGPGSPSGRRPLAAPFPRASPCPGRRRCSRTRRPTRTRRNRHSSLQKRKDVSLTMKEEGQEGHKTQQLNVNQKLDYVPIPSVDYSS